MSFNFPFVRFALGFNSVKLVVLLGRSISLIVGDYKNLDTLKEHSRPTLFESKSTLNSKSAPGVVKVSLQEYSDNRCLLMYRYPSYYLSDPGVLLPPPAKHLDKLYSQFYTFTPDQGDTFSVQAHLEASRYAIFEPPCGATYEEIDSDKVDEIATPISLKERDDIFKKYLWETKSLKEMELEEELKSRERIWQSIDPPFVDDETDATHFIPEPLSEDMRRIHQLNSSIEISLPVYITMLVRLLFYLNVSSSTETYTNDHGHDNMDIFAEHDKKAEISKRDTVRHKEIITNYISQILLDLVKAAKRHRKNQ